MTLFFIEKFEIVIELGDEIANPFFSVCWPRPATVPSRLPTSKLGPPKPPWSFVGFLSTRYPHDPNFHGYQKIQDRPLAFASLLGLSLGEDWRRASVRYPVNGHVMWRCATWYYLAWPHEARPHAGQVNREWPGLFYLLFFSSSNH